MTVPDRGDSLNFAPIGHTDKDRAALQLAAALVEAHVRDDVLEVEALTSWASLEELLDVTRGLVCILQAAHARMPDELGQLLGETRAQNMPQGQ